ncbi:MAG: PASTA domain-containing protein [Ruminococcaceae bacterium]|nr:PASTA domain-containing protein [Oscillospiraceae bacterium]
MESSENKYKHLVGTVIDERYEVLSVKGIGGMAVVLKARDRVKNRIVAIKMLNEKHSNDSVSVRRFVNESRAIALLSNEHIVDIYDVAFTGKSKYIVMEYIDGITLREYMRRNGPLGFEKSMDFIIQILSALQHAHEKGVVHRDIKPQNIMVQANGRLKVTDFGIAQISDSEKGNSGVAMGTVYYISPEQASGKATTFSSDIYSVGIMLYEMATGKLPFEGDTPLSIAMMQVNTPPARPSKINPQIPHGLEQIILRALNKEPQSRFRSAKSMLRACDIIRKDKTVVFEEASATPAQEPVTPPEKKRKVKASPRTLFPIILGVTTAFLLVLTVAGIILISSLIRMTSNDSSLVVSIPDLSGEYINAARKAELAEDNIELKIEEVNNDTYAPGQVVSQEPKGGQTRKITSSKQKVVVKVQVSLGKKSFSLADYVNQEHRAVQLQLEEKGAKVAVEEQNDSSVIKGYIISTAPAPGTVINSGDTVTLYVSKGAATSSAKMVNVVGKSAADARRTLHNNNFIIGETTYEHSDAPEGNVIRQSIAPGASTVQGLDKVDLVVSLGPAPTPETEETP